VTNPGESPGLADRVKARWRTLQAKRPAVRHLAMAWQRLGLTNGNQYAAAITFFSFLALFPLLLLAVAITGFVLHANPGALHSLFKHVTDAVPGSAGNTLRKSIQSAIDARASVGIIGLVGVLLTGLGWIGNLRAALDAVWKIAVPKQNFLMMRVRNLGVLAGLGLGTLISLGFTVIGTALTDKILTLLHLDGLPGMFAVVKVLGILLAVAGDVVIFSWVLIGLPHTEVPRRIGIRGAVLAAIGFEILKIVGTYTIAASSGSPTAGPFAGLVAVLVWIQLVARLMLFSTAWVAVASEDHAAAVSAPAPELVAVHSLDEGVPLSPVAVGATLVGAGAVAGAAFATLAVRRAQGRRAAA